MLSKRWLRQVARLTIGVGALVGLMIMADVYLNFLPVKVQTRLPHHIPSPVVLDIKVETCYRASSCGSGTDGWYKHPKNLYLNQNWFKKAYLYTKRVEESELKGQESVLLDLALPYENAKVIPQRIIDEIRDKHPEQSIDSLDTTRNTELAGALGWTCQDPKLGIWVKKGRYRPGHTVSQLKVLFGDHAQYPIPGWKLLDGGIQISQPIPRIAIRRGIEQEITRPELKFNSETGKFKIMQIADLHMSTDNGNCDHPVGLEPGETCVADKRTLDFVRATIEREHPDFIVFTGDQHQVAPDSETALLKAVAPAISRDIPWTLIFGNHDHQGSLTNEELMNIAMSLPGCLATPGNATGVGNYMLHATVNNHWALVMYFMDSHDRMPNPNKGYDYIRQDQIDLMKDLHRQSKPELAKYSHIPLSMAFYHIPLQSYRDVQGGIVGKYREAVMAQAEDAGMLDLFNELEVSVATAGHDHCNDYCVEQGNTWLCYGGSAGEGAYGGYPDEDGNDTQRRIRVFEVDSKDSSITSWKWVRDAQDVLDRQRLVEGGKTVHIRPN